MPQISVIIPVCNGASTLHACLQSLNASTFKDFEIIVSDDCSTDTSVEIAKSFGVTIVRSPHHTPLGAASARNRGARHARGEILFFTDADVMVQENTLETLLTIMRTFPDINACIGSYTRETPVTNFSSRFKNYLHYYTHQTSLEQAITFWTACGALYRRVFHEVGGFNESYTTASVEDIAFGYKLTKRGYRIRLDKSLQVTHLKRYTFGSLIYSDIFNRAIPWTRLMLREKTFRSDLNTSMSSGFGLFFAYSLIPTTLSSLAGRAPSVVPLIFLILFLAMNARLYRMIFSHTDFSFTIRFILMSYLYYLYSGLGLFLAVSGFLFGYRY